MMSATERRRSSGTTIGEPGGSYQYDQGGPLVPSRSYSPSRPPTSAEIDAVIAAAMANAPPVMPEPIFDGARSVTPLMTNLLPAAVGADGRVNLFVGNLPYRVRWQDLKDLFRKAGTVLRADVSLGPDNRSRGYGTVLMGSREDAARAIDRFNGYNWQTRTLEVRPDRLPPEYEAQPHHPTNPIHRPPMFPYQNIPGMHPPFPPSNHLLPPNGQHWLPGQPPPRPPAYNPSQPFPPQMPVNGSSPIPGSHSPAPPFAGLPIPISSQNSGGYVPFGASPLAGSLSAGNGPAQGLRRDSHAMYDPPPEIIARSISPAGLQMRQTSSAPPDMSPPNQSTELLGNRTPPTPLHDLSEDDFPLGSGPDLPNPPLTLEGLASQGMILGHPKGLHDRVVFVSNLPLTMQWQDLKDLLRPAGLIIRADIARDEYRRPRGYGTALFANEADAARAVQMFNGKDLGGRDIRVYLERDIHLQMQNRQTPPAPPAEPSTGSQSPISPTSRLPWSLNTSLNSTPSRLTSLSKDHTPNPHSHTPAFRSHHHPGPITMPSFTPMDNPLSPLQTRGLPPMTPSMPGFVFNAHPETPPLHHPFFSPGIAGPFSPGIPVTSPTAFGPYNPFLNAAPGAPVGRFPHAGSAQLGTPTTQSFPNLIVSNGTPSAPGAAVPISSDYFPSVPYHPDSPSPRIPLRPMNNASPLNAKDRLASSPAGNKDPIQDLANQARSLNLSSSNGAEYSVNSSRNNTPPSPSAGTSKTKGDVTDLSKFKALYEGTERGRQSLDEHRPSITSGLHQGERRASFGNF